MVTDIRDARAATNQAPPLAGHDVVATDLALVEAVTRHASAEVVADLADLGREAGSAEAREHGLLANQNPPRLTPYDRYGNRVDEVVFHPSWHWLMDACGRPRAAGRAVGAAARRAAARPRTPGSGVPGVVADRARPRLSRSR